MFLIKTELISYLLIFIGFFFAALSLALSRSSLLSPLGTWTRVGFQLIHY